MPKCKNMLISKKPDTDLNSKLVVDNWITEHVENMNTGEYDLIEQYEGRIKIDKTENQKYLGFLLSYKGDNMKNITNLKNKSIGITRKPFYKIRKSEAKKILF